MRTPMMFFVIVMAVMIGATAPIGAAGNNIVTGKQLPSFVKEAVKGLQKDIPALSGLPDGYSISLDDVKFVRRYEDIQSEGFPAEAIKFIAQNELLAFTINNSLPIFVIGESPDYKAFENWLVAGRGNLAVGMLKGMIAHEVLHLYQTTGDEESVRLNEIAAYELQLQIFLRDVAAGRIPKEFSAVTAGIELSLQELRRGEDLAKNGLALFIKP